MPYIYGAELWCNECGRAIRAELDNECLTPDDPDDDATYDSDEYPKYGNGGKSDSPDHCASGDTCLEGITLASGRVVGALVCADLTREGERYVLDQHAHSPNELTHLWLEHYGVDLPSCRCGTVLTDGICLECAKHECRECGEPLDDAGRCPDCA